jgi:hypothetical protein
MWTWLGWSSWSLGFCYLRLSTAREGHKVQGGSEQERDQGTQTGGVLEMNPTGEGGSGRKCGT